MTIVVKGKEFAFHEAIATTLDAKVILHILIISVREIIGKRIYRIQLRQLT